MKILIDADGCPVKSEVYQVARRYGLAVTLVANSRMRTPTEEWVKLVLVGDQLDAADDWIADHAAANDIVITGDIPLASRCLPKGARALSPRGRVFTEASIGDALATRDILTHIRGLGAITGGPAPFEKRDRSRFRQKLDDLIQAALRGERGNADANEK